METAVSTTMRVPGMEGSPRSGDRVPALGSPVEPGRQAGAAAGRSTGCQGIRQRTTWPDMVVPARGGDPPGADLVPDASRRRFPLQEQIRGSPQGGAWASDSTRAAAFLLGTDSVASGNLGVKTPRTELRSVAGATHRLLQTASDMVEEPAAL